MNKEKHKINFTCDNFEMKLYIFKIKNIYMFSLPHCFCFFYSKIVGN